MKKAITILSVMTALVLCGCNKDDKPLKDEPVKGPDVQMHNGHEYVDLGLSVKWATMNVGADSITGYGDYFAWGDTVTYYEEGYAREDPQDHWKTGKTGYDWGSYKYCNIGDTTMTKYCIKGDYGTVDGKTVLDLEDDVAHVNWGGDWRMPTLTEVKELSDTTNCTWALYQSGNTEFGGVAGYKVTSKKNGNSIFLPIAGYRNGIYLSLVGVVGYYWSSSLYNSDNCYACYLSLNTSSHNTYGSSRWRGSSVRPVFK